GGKMASAALTAGLLEALVSRGTTPSGPALHQSPASPPISEGQEDQHSAINPFLHHYQQQLQQFQENQHNHSNSDSAEKEEGGYNDQLNHLYKRHPDDPELSPAAKKRRKQSNPLKFGSSSDEESAKGDQEQMEPEISNNLPEEESRSIICPHCHVEAPNEETLRRHIIQEHLSQILVEDEPQQQHELPQQEEEKQNNISPNPLEEGEVAPLNLTSPRLEVRSLSRNQEEEVRTPPTSIPMPPSFGDGKLNLPGLLPFGPPPFLIPLLQNQERERFGMEQERGLIAHHPPPQNGRPRGIFNIDAYCDICHQEFCNKYFLKTHKANKHGIYSPDINSSPTGAPVISTSTPLGPSVTLTSPMAASPLGASPLVGPLSGSHYAGAFIAANMSSMPIRPLLPTHISGISKMSMGGMGGMKQELNKEKSGVINMEAYCELCQKEFCNKYFLKRHKSKIHGIIIDVVTKPKDPSTHQRVAPDRPEGWCDACRKDVGGRNQLNAHKMQVHGPHIVNPLQPPLNPHLQQNKIPGLPNPNMSKSYTPESSEKNRDPREYFNQWDALRENRDMQRDMWDSVRVSIDVKEARDSPKEQTPRSPWDSVSRNSVESNKERDSVDRHEGEYAEIRLEENSSQPDHNQTESHEFPLDPRDVQVMREQQHRDWEQQKNNILEREKEQYLKEKDENYERELLERARENGENKEQHERDVAMHMQKMEMQRLEREREDREREIREQERHHQIQEQELREREQHRWIQEMKEREKEQLRLEQYERERKLQQMEYEKNVKQEISEIEQITRVQGENPEMDHNQKNGSHNTPAVMNEVEVHNEIPSVNRGMGPEGHRTPGGSSTDESSRDAGLIARVGQPAMVQAPPGTKFTPEQLRQLGVINPDAFCQLCCKEFCNKYFLRTHRIKKHGIYTPEFSDRSKQKPDNAQISLARLLERQAFELRPSLPDIEGEIQCEICRRPFPSPYLLQMHKYYFHGPGQELAQQEPIPLHPHPSPHEQLRRLALQAQHHQQQHQQRMEEQHREMQEHKRLQEEERQDKIKQHHEHERSMKEREEIDSGLKVEEIHRPPVIESTGSGESDASEDLRKLQSMIMQLNRHQGEVSVRCRLCHKEVGNKYFLRAHMMTEHGIIGDDMGVPPASEGAQTPRTPHDVSTPKTSPSTTPFTTPLTTGEGQAFCSICKKDFFSRYILQQHMLSAHGIFTPPSAPITFMDRIRAEVESRDERNKPQSTSRSYCEICNKELCNKYFMKTHMLKMHGINMENGMPGGVTCDICNKELCSKYFLRVHKQNTHGLVEDPKEGEEMIDTGEIEMCPICSRRFKNVKWLRTHLTSDHGEEGKEKWRELEPLKAIIEPDPPQGPSCGICGVVVADLVALQIHVIKHHGPHINSNNSHEYGHPDRLNRVDNEDPTELRCSLCPFVAPNPAVLFAHARTHGPALSPFPGVLATQQLTCPMCSETLPGLEAYQQHLIQHQLQELLKPHLEKGEGLESMPEQAQPHFQPEDMQSDIQKTPTKSVPKVRRKRWRCTKCSHKFPSRVLCLAHVHATHNPRSRGTWLGRSAIQNKLYKCRKCGAVARKLSALRQHIRQQHRLGPSVPTSHATPTKSTANGRFVMQPFLLNSEHMMNSENKINGVSDNNVNGNEKDNIQEQFVPSLVYLPVAKRVDHPLTVSFSLTPA
ncbi:unnamed protein product, partial [Meganyctiphanes norvegica]